MDQDLNWTIDEDRERFRSYLIPGTSVLRNRFDVDDPGELRLLEGIATAIRTHRLADDHTLAGPATLDYPHLRRVHGYLFQDVYDWAGEERTCHGLRKGDKPFADLHEIPTYLSSAHRVLVSDDFRSSDAEAFATAGAEAFVLVNQAHPFREGNGRSTRALLELAADHQNPYHKLYFTRWDDKLEWNQASHDSRPPRGTALVDAVPMQEIFRTITAERRCATQHRHIDIDADQGIDYGNDL
ncbi:Fic family protein [Tsukamurella sp. 8J]|uniref:Fic/DOC family protein n=1 Tax=Tsukamurella sp. 8J TaxID=3031962 RepID=UPI0023B979DD|nr:Fic family protein [Tsukamurella sp. 8J]MDF0531117.1 Fic family protein [Tsukamurella sp. 8J]